MNCWGHAPERRPGVSRGPRKTRCPGFSRCMPGVRTRIRFTSHLGQRSLRSTGMPAATLLLRCESGGGWAVYVDGVQVARILAGQTLEFPVEPGAHTLRLGEGWRRSREVSIMVPPGRQARFVCRPITDPGPDPEGSTDAPLIGDIEALYLVARWLGTVAWHHHWIVVEPEEVPRLPGRAVERDPSLGADSYARAPGAVCCACAQPIQPGQPARRRETGWVHDVCPPARLSGTLYANVMCRAVCQRRPPAGEMCCQVWVSEQDPDRTDAVIGNPSTRPGLSSQNLPFCAAGALGSCRSGGVQNRRYARWLVWRPLTVRGHWPSGAHSRAALV
jgi:hypothetical protein